jgi:hypothetical protein
MYVFAKLGTNRLPEMPGKGKASIDMKFKKTRATNRRQGSTPPGQ